MPEYEPLTLEQALAHLRGGTGKVEMMQVNGTWARLASSDGVTFGWLAKTNFRLVKEEPEIVKPVKCETSRDLKGVSQIYAPEGDYIWTGRPRAQQERLDALLDKFVEVTADWVPPHNPTFLNLRDFLRAEKEAK